MGILIHFPQPGTHSPSGKRRPVGREAHDALLAATYRRDLDRAVALLFEHIDTDGYDGIALVLKPTSPAHKPALVVGGFYRHRLTEAANATMQLYLALKLRAREQDSEAPTRDAQTHNQRPLNLKE